MLVEIDAKILKSREVKSCKAKMKRRLDRERIDN